MCWSPIKAVLLWPVVTLDQERPRIPAWRDRPTPRRIETSRSEKKITKATTKEKQTQNIPNKNKQQPTRGMILGRF